MAKEQPWDKKWNNRIQLSGGGQCENYKITSIDKEDKTVYVLKVIKDATKRERRVRFYREVHNYIALDSHFFPKIIDHNCTENPDVEKRLYMVYPFIEGSNLEEYIQKNGRLSLNQVLDIVLLLAEMLEYCHQNDIVHRDIKPDNIILKNDDINQPILIDFGLSASEDDIPLKESGDLQLGNRFLYLPELKYSGSNKRDKRSDITYLVGIFFFVLTGEMPTHFIDEQGRYPHQRVILKDLVAPINDNQYALLLKLFDKGFQPQLNSRFQTIDHLREYLNKIKISEKEAFDFESFLQNSGQESQIQLEETLNKMLPLFRSLFEKLSGIISQKFPDIEVGRGGPSVLPHWDPMCIVGHYSVTEKFKREITQSYMLKLYPNGTEYVLSLYINKDETPINRFQNIEEINQGETIGDIYKTMMAHFAELKRSLL